MDAARAREWGGAGLGLSIARWAVEAHGGEIGLRSEGACGSTFWIRLPKAGVSDQSKT
jgi:signal transduction histidine kinase